MKKGTKILMALMKLDIGGAETHVVELSKELVRRGYEVVIASNGGAYESEINESGIKHYTVPLQNKNPLNVLKAIKELERIIKAEDIDIVHSHARIPSFILGLLHKKLKFPFITSAHWVFNTSYGLKYLTNWGQKTVAVSDDIKKYLIDNYKMQCEDIFVTINGIDLDKFSADVDAKDIKEEFSVKDDDFCIVGVSRMDRDRSFASKMLISIAPKLKEHIPNLKIIVVGGGNDEQEAMALTEKANRECGSNIVQLAGARVDINKFVAVSSLFVGVSRAALEAMAAGKNTIVAGNEGYIGLFEESKLEVGINTNFCCRGCPETSSQVLFDDIIKYYNMSEEEKNTISEYARSTVEKYYSVGKMADDYIEAYKSLPPCNYKNSGDILISGYYGFGNSGDDALLLSIISQFEENYTKRNITVLSSSPLSTKNFYNVNAINRINPFKVIKAIKKCKLFISGGGTLIQDDTSTKSLLYYLYLIRLAQIFKKKIMLYANGIGPVNKKSNFKKCTKILNNVDVITVRDKKSLHQLELMGITKPVIKLTADPVFMLSPTETAQSKKIDGEFFCVSVRNSKKMKPEFSKAVALAVSKISKEYSLTPVFLPLQAQDKALCREIADMTDASSVVIDEMLTPLEIIELIQKSRMVVGMRLHMLIYAAAVAVPLVGIVYDPKVSGFMEYANQNLFVDVDEIDQDNLYDRIKSCLDNIDSIKQQLQITRQDMQNLAKDNCTMALELYLDQKRSENIEGK